MFLTAFLIGIDITLAGLYAWSDNHCFPGQKTLASDAGMGVRSVVRYNKELEGKGFITTKRRGLGKVNVYELHMTIKKKK